MVERSQLSLNTAGLGGASYQLGTSTYTFANTTLDGNTAVDGTGGGAIRVRGGSATLNNSTVTRNEAPNGGGLAAANDGSSITIANTIVAGNTDSNQADGNFPDCLDLNAVGVTTHFKTQGYNILGNAQGCQLSPGTGDQFGTPAAPVNPLLDSNAKFNGGLFAQVLTYALLPGSPAIDRGDPSSSCSSIDARIVQRSLGGRCDSGAYELVKCQTTAVNRVGTLGNDSSTTPELAPTTGADGYLGFDGSDTLQGAEGNDAMCGGSGGDTLTGGPGADFLVGGSDNDTLNGSLGSDRFTGNTGNDTIRARDGKADTVACGAGTDRVTADRTDKVAGDCERVSRG
jgi:Ca2+-binding RTX toxin-like protein